MAALPLRRTAPYLLAGVLVVAVGAYSLLAAREPAPEPVWSTAGPGGGDPSASSGGGAPATGGAGPLSLEGEGFEVAPTTTEPPTCFVQVAGAVARPGVYEVPVGARVFQVLLMAGGMDGEADEEAVPLAAVVQDGACIRVPRLGEAAAAVLTMPESAGPVPSGGAGGPLSLNTASEAELDTLPGIGPKTAQLIIAYRTEYGPFRSVDQLDEVSGIGPATVERLRGLVVP